MRLSSLALPLALSMALLGALACIPGAAPPPSTPLTAGVTPSPVPPTPTPEGPRYGGILVYAHRADPPDYSMWEQVTIDTMKATAPVYNNLVSFDALDPTMRRIVPDLAESWQQSPDGLTWVFHLRRGVRFHDGSPFTCEDARFTLFTVRTGEGLRRSPKGALFRAYVKEERCLDDATLVVVLHRPAPSLLPNLAQGYLGVFPKAVFLREEKGMQRVMVGTGPFRLQEHRPGEVLEYQRNQDYWRKDRPFLDGLRILIVPDRSARLSLLRTGRIHWEPPTPAQVKILRRENPEIRIATGPVLIWDTVQLIWGKPPWDDPRLREAVSLALDRQAFIATVLDGEGLVGGLLPPGSPFALPQEELARIPGYGGDPEANRERARQLLAQAGFPQGLKVRAFISRKAQIYEDIAVFVAAEMRKVGIEAPLVLEETAAVYDRISRRDFEFLVWVHGAALDDPDAMFFEHYQCESDRNYPGYCRPEAERLLAQQSATMDPQERLRLVWEYQKLVLQDHPKIVLAWRKGFLAYWPQVRNLVRQPSIYNNLRMEHVWLAR